MARGLAERLDRCRRWPPEVADTALAGVVAVVTIVAVLVQSHNDDQPLNAFGVVLLAGQLVPLVWRRRAPVVVAAVSFTCALAYGMAVLPDPPVLFAPLLAFYTMAAYRPRRTSVPVGLAAMAVAALGIVAGDPTDAADVTTGYFTAITAWVIGDTTRGQRERATWLDDRRADAARQAARDERVRIARDLHDVVAHHVSVIAVQAEAAQEVLATRPDRAQAAMGHVADTARTALGELRRVLGVLRSDAALTPQPDLAAVGELVASVRSAGLPVTLRTVPDPARPVDAVVGLTTYRIVQEALTNVLKHAGPCRAVVTLDHSDTDLVVTVTDTGRGAASGTGDGTGPPGQGLVGMRERVAVLGGRFAAGPGDGNGAAGAGGFTVRASLPLEARP
ncbi:MAG TPA: histidine kinase [Acidimicrobiales bacterium]|nr:histidine kinase [Acidimicrobiales bacterium]